MAGNNFTSLHKTVRAVVINGGRVLLCREKKGKLYFLPGSRVESGKRIEETLLSLLHKMLKIQADTCEYIGATSNFYKLDRFRNHQEFDLVYAVRMKRELSPSENENLDFIWIEIKTLPKEKIFPKLLKEKLVDWFDNRQVFWGSN